MSKNYPQIPPEMYGNANVGGQQTATPAPPSYEQATTGGSSASASASAAYTHQHQYQQPPPAGGWIPQPQAQQTHYHQPPPMAGYQQTAAGVTPVVVIQQATVLPLGPEPCFITCPSCHIAKMTRIEFEPSARTHLMAALLCIIGLWCCVCLPYCAGSCMNTNHYCGNCNKFLGTYGAAL